LLFFRRQLRQELASNVIVSEISVGLLQDLVLWWRLR